MPDQEQLNTLADMKDEYEDLAEAEQFAVVVRKTPPPHTETYINI